jgi:hypothetical protein
MDRARRMEDREGRSAATLVIEPFDSLTKRNRDALTEEAERLIRFVETARRSVRFVE